MRPLETSARRLLSCAAALLAASACAAVSPLSAEEEEDAAPLRPEALESLRAKPETSPPPASAAGAAGGMRSRSAPREVSRKYTPRGARIIVYSDESTVESPMVEIPLLFARGSSELRGEQTRANLELLARELMALEEGSRFSIEGHASAEGSAEFNRKLSQERAETVYEALKGLGVSGTRLARPRGFGADHARHPAEAAESDRAEDRRVLVVKER